MVRRTPIVVVIAVALLTAALAQAEPVQKGGLRIDYQGTLSPTRLPREGAAPVTVSVGGEITTTDGSTPPSLQSFEVAINSDGTIDPSAMPVCPLAQIQPASTTAALAACRASLVGEGTFEAAVAIPEQSPFPSLGKVLAFNGRYKGRPAILAHVYGTDPLPTSFTMPMTITPSKGRFGTVLAGTLPSLASTIAYVTKISLTLGPGPGAGRRGEYLEAGCPAPKGFPGAVFPLLRAGFHFADGRTLSSTLNRSCKARG